jgi:hypothetical protein
MDRYGSAEMGASAKAAKAQRVAETNQQEDAEPVTRATVVVESSKTAER